MGEAVVDTTRRGGDSVIIRVRGELDMDTAASLRQVLVDQVERGGVQELVVDLAHLIFMDSTGIGALVAGYGAARHAGIRFVVRNPSDLVYRQLAITGLTELFACPGPAPRPTGARSPTATSRTGSGKAGQNGRGG